MKKNKPPYKTNGYGASRGDLATNFMKTLPKSSSKKAPKFSIAKQKSLDSVDQEINFTKTLPKLPSKKSLNSNDEEGFKFKMNAGKISPYANALAQLALSKKAPKVPKPRLMESANLDTNINVDDQVEATEQAEMRNRMAINQNSRTVGQAIGGNTSIGISAMQNLNKIYGNKERTETQLRNQDAMNKQQVQAKNQQIMSANDNMKMSREAEQVRAQSGALNRLNQEIQMDSAESKRMKRDAAVAMMISLRDNGRGIVSDKLIESLAEQLDINPKELRAMFDKKSGKDSDKKSSKKSNKDSDN